MKSIAWVLVSVAVGGCAAAPARVDPSPVAAVPQADATGKTQANPDTRRAEPGPGSSGCGDGFSVERCVGQGVACDEEPCPPPDCTTRCEPTPPSENDRAWSCYQREGGYHCSALVP